MSSKEHIPEQVSIEPALTPRELESRKDLTRGKRLMGLFIFFLVFLGVVYGWAHHSKPTGPFAPTAAALGVVAEAKTALEAAGGDILEPAVVTQLTQLSSRLGLLAVRLGMGSDFNTVLAQVNSELVGNEVHRAVLVPLFDQLENLIKVGPGSYFWSGSLDRWVELLFWTIVGTLVFLLSELKKYSTQPYKKYRDFTRYTPWYIVNLFRGPFIAMVIMLALLSLSFDAIGISVDLKSAPIEVLIVAAAILGYYSRVADKELDIITESLFKAAWKKANPDEAEKPGPSAASDQLEKLAANPLATFHSGKQPDSLIDGDKPAGPNLPGDATADAPTGEQPDKSTGQPTTKPAESEKSTMPTTEANQHKDGGQPSTPLE